MRSDVMALPLGALVALTLLGCDAEKTVTDPDLTEPTPAAATESEGADEAAEAATHPYEVRIRNLTTGQPFSPGVIVTHTNKASIWQVGEPASEGVRLIAEDGDPATAVAELTGAPDIHQVVTVPLPIGQIGNPAGLPTERTFTIEARANANRLSIAVMLICTNDGFTGVSEVKLPGGFKAEVHRVGGWDAGTEMNNERFDQIVDACTDIGPVPAPPDGNGRIPTSGVIRPHPNIQGVGDLDPALHGWAFPVAEISVRRLR